MAQDIHVLTAQLTAADPQAQCAAAEQLSRRGEAAAPAATALAIAAGTEHEELREYAVAALEDLGPPPINLLAELQKLLESDQEDTAYWAATLLGRLEEAAAQSAPALVQLLNSDRAVSVRERAAWALGKLGVCDSTVRESLEAASKSATPRLAREAQRALDALAG